MLEKVRQKIQKVEPLDSEKPVLGSTSNKGSKRCDVVCRCFCGVHPEDDSISFDIEMQRSSPIPFLDRLNRYGYMIHEKNKISVRELGLLNLIPPKTSSFHDLTSCHAWCEFDPVTNKPIISMDQCMLQVNVIDLRIFRATQELYFRGNKLGIEGITWLKLFGIRQWGLKVDSSDYQYEIFYPKCTDAMIKRCIEWLACLDDKTLTEVMEQCQQEQNGIEFAHQQGLAEGMAKGMAKGRDEGIAFAVERIKAALGEKISDDQMNELLSSLYPAKVRRTEKDDDEKKKGCDERAS